MGLVGGGVVWWFRVLGWWVELLWVVGGLGGGVRWGGWPSRWGCGVGRG